MTRTGWKMSLIPTLLIGYLARIRAALDVVHHHTASGRPPTAARTSLRAGQILLDLPRETGGVEAREHEAVLARAVLDEAVGNADAVHEALDARRGQALVHRAACAAGDHVLLDRHDALVRGREATHELGVEGLHETHVHQRRVELLGDRRAGRDHRPEGEQQQAGAALAPQLARGPRAGRSSRPRRPRPGRARADSARPPDRRASRPCRASAGTRSRRRAP